MKLEQRFGLHRQLEFCSPYGLVQPKSHFALDKVNERLEPLRNQRAAPKVLQHLEVLRRIEKRQMMPALEPFVRPARNRQELVRRREELGAEPQSRRDELADDLPVESVAGDGHTVGADDVARASAPPLVRAHAQNGKVARAAAEVANQDELVAIERLLVAVRRSHRLVLEHDVGEPALRNRGAQPSQRELVIFLIQRVGKMNRSADDHA